MVVVCIFVEVGTRILVVEMRRLDTEVAGRLAVVVGKTVEGVNRLVAGVNRLVERLNRLVEVVNNVVVVGSPLLVRDTVHVAGVLVDKDKDFWQFGFPLGNRLGRKAPVHR